MANTTNIKNLIINKVESQAVFDYMISNGLVNEDELYLVQGESGAVLYTQQELTEEQMAQVRMNIGLEVVQIANGGTGRTTIADTEYTVIKYRGSALVSSETDPTENGTICWTYE